MKLKYIGRNDDRGLINGRVYECRVCDNCVAPMEYDYYSMVKICRYYGTKILVKKDEIDALNVKVNKLMLFDYLMRCGKISPNDARRLSGLYEI